LKNYLVILAGSPRGGNRTWESLEKYVLKHLNADLAICLSNKWNLNNSILKNAKYSWVFDDYSDSLKYYEENFFNTWREYLMTGQDTGLLSSGGVHFVFKDYVLKNYLSTLEKYDFIIYTRFDQFYTDYHPKGIEDKILIPSGEDYFGICDRHALVPVNLIKKFLRICEFIDSGKALKNVSEFNNCETTYKQHLESEGLLKKVERFNRHQFTSSLRGEHTNWRVAKYRIYLYKNLMTKYPDEFLDSLSNLIDKKGISRALFQEPVLFFNYIYIKSRIILSRLKF